MSNATNAALAANDELSLPTALADRINYAYELTRNVVEAHLLERIWHWFPRAHYEDDEGQRWLIRTAEEFKRDGMPWCVRTIQRALRRLVDKGFIEIRRSWHRFRMCAGRMACSYIRVLSEAYGAYATKCTQSTLPHISKETSKGTSGCAAAPTGGAKNKNAGEGKSLMASAKEIFEQIKSKPLPTARTDRPLKADDVHAELRRHHKDAWPDEIPPEKSAKRLAHCKQFLEKARAASCTDAQILAALRRYVIEFNAFRGFLQERAGWTVKEMRPTHFLLAYHAELVMNFAKSANAPVAGDANTQQSAPSQGADMPTLGSWKKNQ